MSSAMQLSYQKVQGVPKLWYSPYIENMRPLRNYPDYWRFIDTKSWTNGPDVVGGKYPLDPILWRAEVDGDTINIYRETDGTDGTVRDSFTHTSNILSVSLEFDQLGRRIVAYEDELGKIILDWYDPIAADQVMTVIDDGVTPHMVSTRYYKRAGTTTDSERLLFYVKTSTKQIVYRRQTERYQTEHTIPSAPADVDELLRVSKNLLGGLTVVATYEDTVESKVKAYSWTAINEDGPLVLGDDRHQVERAKFSVTDADAVIQYVFSIKETFNTETSTFSVPSTTVLIEYKDSEVVMPQQTETGDTFSVASTNVSIVYISATVDMPQQEETGDTFSVTSTTVSIVYQEALVENSSEEPNATFSVVSTNANVEYINV